MRERGVGREKRRKGGGKRDRKSEGERKRGGKEGGGRKQAVQKLETGCRKMKAIQMFVI